MVVISREVRKNKNWGCPCNTCGRDQLSRQNSNRNLCNIVHSIVSLPITLIFIITTIQFVPSYSYQIVSQSFLVHGRNFKEISRSTNISSYNFNLYLWSSIDISS